MARYLVETSYTADTTHRRAASLAATRTPEVTIAAAFVTTEPPTRCAWILLSPSEAHIRQWALDIDVDLVRCTTIVVLD